MDDETNGSGSETAMEAGGPVDECSATLAVYGDDLDPDAVSSLLGSTPSAAHRKGEREQPTSSPFPSGAWLLKVRTEAPSGPNEAIASLLSRFPNDIEFWRPVIRQFRVSIQVAIHTSGWNRGFGLSAGIVTAVGQIGLPIEFDLYMYGDESAEGSDPKSRRPVH